jgi:hypothetical protein
MEVIMAKDWFNKHIVVMTLDDDKKKEKQIKAAIKKAMIKKFTKIKRKVNNG